MDTETMWRVLICQPYLCYSLVTVCNTIRRLQVKSLVKILGNMSNSTVYGRL